ncbi:MAG: hypothetical protein ACXABO_10040 [Promethearchaeota archaeon]|jgi:hypothetical protein
MAQDKSKYMTIGQIDATGVRGPHEKELEDISKSKFPIFLNIDIEQLKKTIENDVGGRIENIGFSEDWTITLEMFPEVNIHMVFSYFGDEFGDGIEAEFKFYFSGERASWVPGEDSATYVDIIMDFLERKLKGQEPFEKNFSTKTELMEKVLKQRSEPFRLLKSDDQEKLSSFLGATITEKDGKWQIKKEIFPKISTEITWDKKEGLNIEFSGENLSKNIDNYHVEFVGIFVLNHILRFITVQNDHKNVPDICYIMFSRFYSKNIGKWDHRVV